MTLNHANIDDNDSDVYRAFNQLFAIDEEDTESDSLNVRKARKKGSKQQRYEMILEHKRCKRTAEHRRRRQRRKNMGEALTQKVLPFAMNFCIDFSMASVMSTKEVSRLIRQLGRIRGLQKRYLGLNVTLCSLGEDVAAEARQVLTGFDKYGWKLISEDDFFAEAPKKLVYLCPDSDLTPLLDVSSDQIFVLGGLVDETGVGSLTRKVAEVQNAEIYRLPIPEFMQKKNRGTFNVMLPINLVVEILAEFAFTKQWGSTLAELLPARIGYEPI